MCTTLFTVANHIVSYRIVFISGNEAHKLEKKIQTDQQRNNTETEKKRKHRDTQKPDQKLYTTCCIVIKKLLHAHQRVISACLHGIINNSIKTGQARR